MSDLAVLGDELLLELVVKAERSLAMCEPLRWKSDEGILVWLEARGLVRELQAESLRRVNVDLEGFDA